MCRQCKGGTCLWLWFTTKTMNTQSVPSYCIISCLSPGALFMLCSCCCLFSRYPAFQNILEICLQEPNSFTKDVDAISCVPGARSFWLSVDLPQIIDLISSDMQLLFLPFLGTSLVPWKNAKPVWWSKDISSQRFAVYSATDISFDSGT